VFEKNKKIIAMSFFNSLCSGFLMKREISFLRCHLQEVANLCGVNKVLNIKEEDIKSITSSYKGNIPLAVDVPILSLLSKNEISIEKMLNFANATNADYLSIDLNYFDFDLIKKGSQIGLKFIAYSNYNSISVDFIKEKAIEFQASGGELLILENFPDDFIQMLHSTVKIPIISDKGKNCDGNYIRIDRMLGLTNEESEINMKKLFLDTVDEKIFKIKK
jgi:ketopantoate hydroxymethyltransferase